MSNQEFGQYTHALVRSVPDSFVKAIGLAESIDLRAARAEHNQLIQHLRSMGLIVVQVPADESLPDCPFVEDTAIACNGLALITRPGHPTRQREVYAIKRALIENVQFNVVEMNDSIATLDGSDVLFTGKEFFVGLSDRTNFEGADFLAATFPDFQVTAIQMPPRVLHLKSVVSMAGPNLICCSRSQASQDIVQQIGRTTEHHYQLLTLPDEEAANVIYANGRLVHRTEFSNSLRVLETKVTGPRLAICTYNLSRPSGTLSSLVLLINKHFY